MGGLKDLLIRFDQPMRVYFPGDVVSGQVLVNLTKEKSFKKIQVELVGKGTVEWTEQRTVNNSTHTDHFSNYESYVEHQLTVHQGPDLPAGDHVIPFSLALPPNVPSSFEGSDGNVRYYVRANIVRDWKWDHKVKEHIMVNGICDLNLLPSAKQEGLVVDHKTLGCLCWKSGPITATLHLNRTGYVSGEMIKFNVEVENLSSRDMESTFLSLQEVVIFKTFRKNKTKEREVERLARLERISPGSSDYWQGTIRLPSLPPSGLGGHCTIIDVQYRLDFHVDPSGPSFDLVVRFPFILGTIPLQESIAGLTSPYDSQFGGGFSSIPPPPEQFKLYPDLPPPTYTESRWGGSDVKHADDDQFTAGDFQFVPRYVTYQSA